MLMFFLKFINPVKYAQLKSTKVFNVFSKTVDELSKINVVIEAKQLLREEKIKVIQIEHELLSKTKLENEKIVNKINEFFK